MVIIVKGQLILKADWCAIDSPKNRTDEFVLFAFLLFTANKSYSSVRFLGESMAPQSAFQFYLTFKGQMYVHIHLYHQKPDNLQYNTLGRWVDGTIVSLIEL